MILSWLWSVCKSYRRCPARCLLVWIPGLGWRGIPAASLGPGPCVVGFVGLGLQLQRLWGKLLSHPKVLQTTRHHQLLLRQSFYQDCKLEEKWPWSHETHTCVNRTHNINSESVKVTSRSKHDGQHSEPQNTPWGCHGNILQFNQSGSVPLCIQLASAALHCCYFITISTF